MNEFGFTSSISVPSGLNFKGSWNANTNSPFLSSGVGTAGDYYIVSVAGTTNLDGVTDWQVGDWAIFEGTTNQWQKIDNHDIQAYTTVQDEGVSLPQQSVLDFQGEGVVVTNAPSKTIVTITGNYNKGFFSQIANSSAITNTIVEQSLIGSGLGSLSVPANGFKKGDCFKVNMSGHISSQNNKTLQIKVKTNGVLLGDTGLITMPQTTAKHWTFDVNFVVREVGVAGVAQICSAAQFTYSKDASNAYEGADFVTIENTLFDTTVLNTLEITAQWGNASLLNSIYTNTLNLYKIY